MGSIWATHLPPFWGHLLAPFWGRFWGHFLARQNDKRCMVTPNLVPASGPLGSADRTKYRVPFWHHLRGQIGAIWGPKALIWGVGLRGWIWTAPPFWGGVTKSAGAEVKNEVNFGSKTVSFLASFWGRFWGRFWGQKRCHFVSFLVPSGKSHFGIVLVSFWFVISPSEFHVFV